MILEVACPIPLNKTFDYKPPDTLTDLVPDRALGARVQISFGKKEIVGLVVGIKEKAEAPAAMLKSIKAFLDPEPLLNRDLFEFARWLSDRYVCSYGEALFMLLPPGKGNPKAFKDHTEERFYEELPPWLNKEPPPLTDDQKKAAALIHEAIYKTEINKVFLLLGAAATGKTEVYMAAIKDVLDQHKVALYLVPEIGLAIQTKDVLQTRFGEKAVALWHSNMSEKERREEWWRIKRGERTIIVGPRSAALLPVRDIGVIIMDEEHDTSYKEDRKPRFHAREAVLFRARQSRAVALLGSATPSMELMRAALEGEINLIELKERAIPAATPLMTLIDLKEEKSRGALSPPLEKAIGERLSAHEQVILFLNKRGYFRFLRCPSCSWVAQCPKCGIALVEHKEAVVIPAEAGIQNNVDDLDPGFRRGDGLRGDDGLMGEGTRKKKRGTGLLCHYCAYFVKAPSVCPECGHKKIYAGGYGTQRIAEDVERKFPWAHVLRWDRDVSTKKGEQEKIYRQFVEGKADILVGTQLVAQGFNFPQATLVGVIDADVPLYIPDFRAAERTFQLITQVAGRAGRAMVTGEVIIQTRHADHAALRHATKLDYKGFAEEELRLRAQLNYPPYCHLVEVISAARNPMKAESEIKRLADWVNDFKSRTGASCSVPIPSEEGTQTLDLETLPTPLPSGLEPSERRPQPAISNPHLTGRQAQSEIQVLGPTIARRAWVGGKTRFVLLLKVPKDILVDFLKSFRSYLATHPHYFHVDVDPETLH
ncbi:MAG: primosomal protein N' [Elusimicrobia bacterium]|nr:primosomal protein N' [Candidatus Obscuribacterium magneticum]